MEIETENKSQLELEKLKNIIENVTKCKVLDIYCKKQQLETVPVQEGYILEFKVKIRDKEKNINMICYKNDIALKMCLQEVNNWIINEKEKQNS